MHSTCTARLEYPWGSVCSVCSVCPPRAVRVQAAVEPCEGYAPKLQRLPMTHSISQLNEIEPAARDFKLRCDLYEAVGLPIGPIESVYVVLSWGGTERQSAARAPSEGKVRFESAVLGKEGYYEQLEEIGMRLPPDPAQQCDVFVHVCVASPLGDRRIGYRRWGTAQLLEQAGWSAAPQWWQLRVEPAVKDVVSVHGAMLLLALRFGTDKQVKAAAPRRPHVRIPKLMRYELRANIYQARRGVMTR